MDLFHCFYIGTDIYNNITIFILIVSSFMQLFNLMLFNVWIITKKTIKSFMNNKSSDPEGIIAEMLKYGFNYLK